MRCALYTRVSTEEQAREGYSLAAQEERLRAHVKSQGWVTCKTYMDDGYSASHRNRPALKRLLFDGSLKRFDIVLVYKIDRLSRSLKDLIEIVAELNEYGVGFKSCTELIDTTRPEGRLMFHQFGSFAQYEREMISQRTRFGMMKRLRQGLWNGQPPYGYGIEEKKLVPCREEAVVVRRIFDLYLKKNMGVVAIARELNRLGIGPRRGRLWKGNSIHNIVTNPFYAGFVRWGGEMAEGTHEPIIDKELFDRAQRTLKQRNRQTRQLRTPNYLTGLVRCGRCGAPMHVNYPGAESKRRFKYYVCNNRYYYQTCDQEYVRADLLERSVIDEIGKLSKQRQVIAGLVRDYTAHRQARQPEMEEQKQKLARELGQLEQEKESLSKWLVNNALTPQAVSFVNAQIDGYDEKERQVQEHLWQIEDTIRAAQLDTFTAEKLGEYLSDFVNTFEEADNGERVLLVQALVQEVLVSETKKVTVALRPPFGFFTPSLALRGVEPRFEE